MRAIIVGDDEGLTAAFSAQNIEVQRIEYGTGVSLGEAGIGEADLLVLTDVNEAIAIPIAKDVNPSLRVVIYAGDSMPDYVVKQVDFAVSPAIFTPEVFVEELVQTDGKQSTST